MRPGRRRPPIAGVDVVAAQGAGAPDNQFFRNESWPAHGVTPFFAKPGNSRAHGSDERILSSEFQPGLDFWYALLQKITTSP